MPKKEKQIIKKQLSSFDICAMVAELQTLAGSRIEKVFHYPAVPNEVYIKLKTQSGRIELFINTEGWIFTTEPSSNRENIDESDRLTLFAQTMRRLVSNARVESIQQHEFDRIIKIDASSGATRFQLIIELFANGNVILAENGIVKALVSNIEMKDRTLKPGVKYIFPPARVNLKKVTAEEFASALSRSENDIVRALAVELNMGGTYAEEMCLRSGIDKTKKASALDNDELSRLYESLTFLLSKCSGGGYGEIILDENGKSIDVQPWSLHIYEKHQKIRNAAFRESVRNYYSISGVCGGCGGDVSETIERLKRRLEQQRISISETEKQIEKYTRIADSLYQHSPDITRAILLIQKAIERKNIGETVKILKEQGIIKEYTPSDRTFTFSLPLDGQSEIVKIDATKNFHQNVSFYYEMAKKSREKLDGAKTAFQKTLDEINAETKKHISVGGKLLSRRTGRGKEHWFEKYRWFISADGILVIGGRDAASNDKVVKKYLTDNSRYVHAEIHGAPSVVVKWDENDRDAPIPETTLKEACQFALAFSKAWSMKIAHGSAYWVMPEQVSKTPNAGETVPRGGFIIRGKKNYYDSAVQCAIGEIEYKGETKLMAGPLSAVSRLAKKYVVLQPGTVGLNEIAKELSLFFGVRMEDVQKLLPPSDSIIIEKVVKKERNKEDSMPSGHTAT